MIVSLHQFAVLKNIDTMYKPTSLCIFLLTRPHKYKGQRQNAVNNFIYIHLFEF